MKLITTIITSILTTISLAAQQPGINPKNLSDCRTAQLKGHVAIVSETTTTIDYSRHTIEYGDVKHIIKRYYSDDGSITKEERLDGNGLLIQKTIYQYKDGLKSVSTTYDASNTRTLQTLYANTADGFCARLRCTDAIGVTISTSEISVKEDWTKQTEEFNDGEVVNTEWLYNAKGELIKITSKGHGTSSVSTISINDNGHPEKCIVKNNGKRSIIEYSYGKLSPEGNWLEQTISENGTPTEYKTRVITLHE